MVVRLVQILQSGQQYLRAGVSRFLVNETQQMAKHRMNIVQIGGLLLLLVVLPLGSWFYLQTGLDYRLQSIQELQEIARLPAFELTNYNDSTVQSKRFEDYLLIGHFHNEPQSQAYAELLVRLKAQFDDREDVFFSTFVVGNEAEQRAQSLQFLYDYELEDEAQVFMLHDSPERISRLAEQAALPLQDHNMSLADNSLLFFADSASIRGFYDFHNAEDLKRLIKHITLNLHQVKEPDLIFRREAEK